MCRSRRRGCEQRKGTRDESAGSKIKGGGTRLRLTSCLHIGFGGTRVSSHVLQLALTWRWTSKIGVPCPLGYASL